MGKSTSLRRGGMCYSGRYPDPDSGADSAPPKTAQDAEKKTADKRNARKRRQAETVYRKKERIIFMKRKEINGIFLWMQKSLKIFARIKRLPLKNDLDS